MAGLRLAECIVLSSLAFVASGMRTRPHSDLAAAIGRKALCAPEIVQETCSLIGNAAGDHAVTFEEVREMLAATGASLGALWKKAELSADGPVNCDRLCHSVVGFLSNSGVALPDTSDTGCYTKEGQLLCDLDLGAKAVGAMASKADIPNLHDRQYLSGKKRSRGSHSRRAARRGAFLQVGRVGNRDISRLPEAIEYTNPITAAVRIANLYRIYPYTHVTVEDLPSEKPSSLAQRGSDSEVEAQEAGSPDMHGFRGDWQVSVQKRNFQAQAYVTEAIRKFRYGGTRGHMDTWFGEESFDDGFMCRELLRVLNVINNILSNVDYRPGPDCEDDVWAYVYPQEDEGMDGDQFLLFLCPRYLTADEALQVETLTHEASHHATAFTADMCMDEFFETERQGQAPTYVEWPLSDFDFEVHPGDYLSTRATPRDDGNGTSGTEEVWVSSVVRFVKEPEDVVVIEQEPPGDCDYVAYGRDLCQILAERDPVKAIRNADNICYFISDVVDDVRY